MANVRKTRNKTYEIRVSVDGVRRSFYPGPKIRTETQARDIAKKLERLVASLENDEGRPGYINSWLNSLPDRQHDKLAEWGLVSRRRREATELPKLDDWCQAYIKRGKRAESTNDQLDDVRRNLTKYFGNDRLITIITAGDAEDFRIWLETEGREVPEGAEPAGLGVNTVRRRIGRAREFFNLAVRRKIIDANPFAGEAVTVNGNPDRQFFVPAKWIEQCIAVANCEDWRIMLAFARYAGMRSHETRLQRWSDVDLSNRRMIVRSNKNPPSRVCPIFPELLPHLMRAREMATGGTDLIVTRYNPTQGINETFKKIVARAGLQEWPKLMQNLRATRETELIATYPIKDVASWLGNSAPIAMKHYAMTMQASFNRAIEQGAGGVVEKPPQNPPHSTASDSNHQSSPPSPESVKPKENKGFEGLSTAGDDPSEYRRRDSNPHSLAGTGF